MGKKIGIPVIDRLIHMMISFGIRGVNTLRSMTGRREIMARNKYGAVFVLRPDDYIDRITLRDGYYESEVLEAILDGLPQGAVVWDIGANFGLHAVTLKVMRPDARVICFEPVPDQADRIAKHAALNDVKVEVLRLALGEQHATSLLHCVSGNPGMSTLVPWDKASYTSQVTCTIESGDDLITAGLVPPPQTIKIDIEGGEHAALRGLQRTLALGRSRLIFEGGEDLAAIVSGLGFEPRRLDRSEETGHALNNYTAAWTGIRGSEGTTSAPL